MQNVGDWLKQAQNKLFASTAFEDDVHLTLKFLLEARLDFSSFNAYRQAESALSSSEVNRLNTDLNQLIKGVPLPYVIGEWSFYGLDFIINANVLIPRPETELLVEEAIDWLKNKSETKTPNIYDIGTGSGIIAITIAKRIKNSHITASDISRNALDVCHQNIKHYGLEKKITTLIADGIPTSKDEIDLLCANLPYIPEEIVNELKVVEYEPRLALDGGNDGLRIIEKVLSQACQRMKKHSLLLFEIEASQGLSSHELAMKYFPHSTITIVKDLAGKDRVLRIENL